MMRLKTIYLYDYAVIGPTPGPLNCRGVGPIIVSTD